MATQTTPENPSPWQDLQLSRAQADRLIIGKVKQIFEMPAVLEAVKTAIRDPKNPLELSDTEQKLFQTLDGGLKKVGRIPGIGRVAKGASAALDNRIRDEAVSSDRSKTARSALLDQLDEPITVGALETAMESMGDHVKEFKVMGFDNPEKIRDYIPAGQDVDATIEKLKHFSESELQAVGALDRNWQKRVGGPASERGAAEGRAH